MPFSVLSEVHEVHEHDSLLDELPAIDNPTPGELMVSALVVVNGLDGDAAGATIAVVLGVADE